jgi:hypothetical protein
MHFKIALFVLLSFILFSGNAVFAGEAVQIQFGELPDAVKKAASDFIQKQRITKITKISDGDHVKFMIESDQVENKRNIVAQNMVIANTGKIMKLVQQVPFLSLPFEQMNEIEKRYPGIKVDEVESVQIHYSDVLGTASGQKIKFRIFANGAIEEIPADQQQTIDH